MNESTFRECFDWIEKFHSKRGELSPLVRAEWKRHFEKEHDEVFCEAAQLATHKLPPGFFPTIERMQQFVTEAREILWQKIKTSEPNKPLSAHIARLKQRSAVPTEALENFRNVFGKIGKLPKDEWLKLGIDSGMLKETDAEQLKEQWDRMGASRKFWNERSMFDEGDATPK